MPEQMIWVDEKGKRALIPPKLDERQLDALSKLLDKLPEIIPYLAAFGYGFLAGYLNEKNATGAARVGCEAVMFMHLASGLPSNSLVPSPTQVFGIAGLTSIGLSIPMSASGESVQRFFKNFPWVYATAEQAPLGGIDLKPLKDFINRLRVAMGLPPLP